MTIPLIKEIEFEYGRSHQLTPRVRRVIARNPGPFTFTGTGTYIIGHGEVAVIDPGPVLETHFDAIKAALIGEKITHILVTHSHMDHSPLAGALAKWAGCHVYAKGPAVPSDSGVRLEAGDDLQFRPDEIVGDDWRCSGPDWTIEAIETPGHTSNHLCFALAEERIIFSGDHIMGWSTSVISPPDGDMGHYIQSLEKVQNRHFKGIYPSHGAPILDDPHGFINAYIAHRAAREKSILTAIENGHTRIIEIVSDVYRDVDRRLHPAACHSVLAHLIYLHRRGVVSTGTDGEPTINCRYTRTTEIVDAG